ncbi:MAG TPA: DUF3298 domain-containing protein [Chitinophagaceae bacterium]|nr:DUF3298 domain-containing protein [Chitinophagaceae bacterium]
MKKTLLVSFLLMNGYWLFAQNERFYKVYEGKAGNMDATLLLCKSGNSFGGYVWFGKTQWPIPIYGGNRAGITDSITLAAGTEPYTLNLTGVFISEKFTGTSSLQLNDAPAKNGPLQMQVNNNRSFTAFSYFSAEDSAKLPAKIRNESTSDYIISTIWPEGNSTLDNAIKVQIRKMLELPATVATPAAWIASQVKKSAASWKATNSKLSPKDAADMGLSLSEQEETRIMVMYENEKYITLANYNFSYTGGAHGNYGTGLVVLNKQNGKQVRMADVLNTRGIKLLPAILDKVARLQFGIKNNLPLDQNDFLVKTISPSKNFYITSTGIGFLYAPYEIKSFADGDINLLIPFTALTNYLQSDFRY